MVDGASQPSCNPEETDLHFLVKGVVIFWELGGADELRAKSGLDLGENCPQFGGGTQKACDTGDTLDGGQSLSPLALENIGPLFHALIQIMSVTSGTRTTGPPLAYLESL